uniref:Uncharacterized protein n=1 Tax=Setaria italica TaxID=4555 RepID=K3XU34_SETIT
MCINYRQHQFAPPACLRNLKCVQFTVSSVQTGIPDYCR